MRPSCRSLLPATFALTCTALAPAADLPANPAPTPAVEEEAPTVVTEPRPGPAGNASVQPIAQPAASDSAQSVESLRWPEPSAGSPHGVSRWYGGRTLLIDGASVALLVAGLSLADRPGGLGERLAALSLVGYVFGAPVVHLVHEHPERALISLVLRGGLPLLFGSLGAEAEHCDEDEFFCGVGGAVLGGLAGVATAVVVDAAVLTHDSAPAKRSSAPSSSMSRSPAPSLGVFSDGRRTLITAGGYF